VVRGKKRTKLAAGQTQKINCGLGLWRGRVEVPCQTQGEDLENTSAKILYGGGVVIEHAVELGPREGPSGRDKRGARGE